MEKGSTCRSAVFLTNQRRSMPPEYFVRPRNVVFAHYAQHWRVTFTKVPCAPSPDPLGDTISRPSAIAQLHSVVIATRIRALVRPGDAS